uniref:Uncharacterized protein n=1 Tax=Anopheles minimus TaxID=112268 RepID=A0A182WPC8_9DIPT
ADITRDRIRVFRAFLCSSYNFVYRYKGCSFHCELLWPRLILTSCHDCDTASACCVNTSNIVLGFPRKGWF